MLREGLGIVSVVFDAVDDLTEFFLLSLINFLGLLGQKMLVLPLELLKFLLLFL